MKAILDEQIEIVALYPITGNNDLVYHTVYRSIGMEN